jgi:hypothetical protein
MTTSQPAHEAVLAALRGITPGSKYTPKPSKQCAAESFKVRFDNFAFQTTEDWTRCKGLSYSDDVLCSIHRSILNKFCAGESGAKRSVRIKVPASAVDYKTCYIKTATIKQAEDVDKQGSIDYVHDTMKDFLEIGNISHLLCYLASKYGESIIPVAPPMYIPSARRKQYRRKSKTGKTYAAFKPKKKEKEEKEKEEKEKEEKEKEEKEKEEKEEEEEEEEEEESEGSATS